MGSEPRALQKDNSEAGKTDVLRCPTESPSRRQVQAIVQEDCSDLVIQDATILLWREVLNLMLEGIILPSVIARELGTTPELIRSVQDSTEFLRLYEGAKKDMAASAVDRTRAKAHIWLREMEKLAYCPDPHVRRAALTDLLNRAGTAAAAKVDLGPAAYRKAVERYIEPEN